MNTKYIFSAFAFAAVVLSGCTGSRYLADSGEVDDVYFTKADEAFLEEQRQDENPANADFYREQVGNEGTTAGNPQAYDEARYSKYGEDESNYGYDNGYGYQDDDFYYSRRVRRFNTRSWSYYDPYFAYDPYYVIGTPTWSYYRNDPWFYDPYFYQGPSYAWTYGWGNPGYAYYPYQYGWNRPWGYGGSYTYVGWSSFGGWNSGFGNYYGGYGGFGGYGGYGGVANGYYNPYCPPGFYGGGTGGFASAGGYQGSGLNNYGPRNNPSSLNTTNLPGNQPRPGTSQGRPYQGEAPVGKLLNLGGTQSVTPTASGQVLPQPVNAVTGKPVGNPNPVVRPNPTTGNNTARPTYNTGRPKSETGAGTYSRPREVRPSGTYTRPTTRPAQETRPVNGTTRPTQGTRPTQVTRPNNNGGTVSPPRNDNYSRPNNVTRPNNNVSRPTRTISRPNNNVSRPTSSPSLSRPSNSGSSGSFSRPSSGGSSGSKSSFRRR